MPRVEARNNEPFERVLRRFKKNVEDSGLLIELRAREFYEKPTTKRKRAKAAAKKRWQRKMEGEIIHKKRMY